MRRVPKPRSNPLPQEHIIHIPGQNKFHSGASKCPKKRRDAVCMDLGEQLAQGHHMFFLPPCKRNDIWKDLGQHAGVHWFSGVTQRGWPRRPQKLNNLQKPNHAWTHKDLKSVLCKRHAQSPTREMGGNATDRQGRFCDAWGP